MNPIANVPDTGYKRVVIVGGGFAGLKLARTLSRRYFQVVLIDRNNFYQFQPLLYQVATAGLEPSSIAFPFRKALQDKYNTHVRVAELQSVDPDNNKIHLDIGSLTYDFLIIATGADTNYFGMENIQKHAYPMKSVSEALAIRNHIINNIEQALISHDEKRRNALLNIAIVGAGPTGVELAGALSELKRFVLPKDYPELDFKKMKIHLFESSDKVLEVMSPKSSAKAGKYLVNMGVEMQLGRKVADYDGQLITCADGTTYDCATLIWAAGVRSHMIKGLRQEVYGRAGRIKVNTFNQVEGYQNIFAAGDIALMATEDYPNGFPQVAQPALQQAKLLARNLERIADDEPLVPFEYKNLGSMATIGRNKAVADVPGMGTMTGFIAWIAWLFVHLMYILGVKNRFFVFLNWAWSYITYDQSLRLILRAKTREKGVEGRE